MAIPQVQFYTLHSDEMQDLASVFNADCVPMYSKEESGFMAVPMVQKGVVVVAVDYDTAPKGIFPFEYQISIFLCLISNQNSKTI